MELDFFLQLAVAAGIGGLVGVEREHREDNAMVIAGIRTFPLVSIAGFLVAILAKQSEAPLLLAVGVGGAFALALAFNQMRQTAGILGLTTPVAMVVTFLLGTLVGYGFTLEAVTIGVVTTFLLLTKRRLHKFAQYLEANEILSALQFITVLFILLPLTATLPASIGGLSWLGRGAIVDPYVILLVVVFVSTISFVSLLAMRQVGPHRGIIFSGMLGGLVNSEATTASLAERAKAHPALIGGAVVGSLLASTTMLVRNAAIAAFAEPTFRLFIALLPYLAPLALVGVALAWMRRKDLDEEVEPVRVANPFAVGPALRFALLFAALSVATELARAQFGDVGVYVTSVGGFVSAGAVIASLANLHAVGAVSLEVALRTALLATSASIAGKLVILRAVEPRVFERARGAYAWFTLAGLVAAAGAFVLL